MKPHALALSLLALAASPAFAQDTMTVDDPAPAELAPAEASMLDRDGTNLGTLLVYKVDRGVRIVGSLEGVSPGEHGFHIHEMGDCDATTGFESAGGHYAPGDHQHGFNNEAGPHEGDIVNVVADDAGTVAIDEVNAMVTLDPGPATLFDADGSALVLHADPDDYQTDPSGNSGERIACGVIEASSQPQ